MAASGTARPPDRAKEPAKDGEKEKSVVEKPSPWMDESGPNILEFLRHPNARHLMTPVNIGAMFYRCPIYQLERAWDIVSSACKAPPTQKEISLNTWLREWTPTRFADVERRMYHRYHPVVMETANKTYMVIAFDKYTKYPGVKHWNNNWLAMPPLNYLPLNCDRVIAGSAGLLVVDGGEQPGRAPILIWGRWQIPNERHWVKHKVRKATGGQSMVCVTNPLTREYILLPPVPRFRINDKIARFIHHDYARTSYHLVIAGWDTKRNHEDRLEELLCIIVYSSQRQNFISANYIERARPLPYHLCGRTGMASINYGVYFGGVRVVPRNDQKAAGDFKIPAIYYFNISKNRKQSLCFDFALVGIAGRLVQPPKVVQAGASRVYATTRYAELPTIIWLVEVLLHRDGTPTGTFSPVTNGVMPVPLFQLLFPSAREALAVYDCHGSDGVVSFKVSGDSNRIVMYDLYHYQWHTAVFPRQANQTTFALCDAVYEPNFLARP